ncbi:MAG: PKD domain-containing protein [bacterium]
MKRKKVFLVVSGILIGVTSLGSESLAQNKECPNCPKHQIAQRSLPPDEPGRSILASSAPGYCPSIGGSHKYEYIQSVSYSQQGKTLAIKANIYIANPTGCVYGKPCPEYDNSPEYVNAWIDWDKDMVFESNERVLDAALTGYKNINYKGIMSTSNIVTIPKDAKTPTWMRINLGWGYDPNDPCKYSWTWGDVKDKEVKLVDLNVTKLEALEDFDIKNIKDPIWTNKTPSEYKPIADGIKSGSFKIKAIIDASPEKPSWKPKCKYKWSLAGISGKGEFSGWKGEFEVNLPKTIGKYTLKLSFELYDQGGYKVKSQSMSHILYATLEDSILLNPKEAWLEKATEWAKDTVESLEISYKLLNSIYLTGWEYAPWGHWGWEYTLNNHRGDCRDYAWLWKNMNKIIGISKNSITIDGVYTIKDPTGTVLSSGPEKFITENLKSLDAQQKEWDFNFHQIGTNKGVYDPVFNIYKLSKEDYEKELIKAFSSTVNVKGKWVNIKTEGSPLETLINKKQISSTFSIGTETFTYILTLNDKTTEFFDPMVNLNISPADDVIVLTTDKFLYSLDEPIHITATYIRNGDAIRNISFSGEVRRPDAAFDIQLYDDGTHGDTQANDGIYSNIFTTTSVEGGYGISVYASGTINGVPFKKETQLPNSILVKKIMAIFTEEYSDMGKDINGNGLYDLLQTTFGINVYSEGYYTIIGILKNKSDFGIRVINTTYLHPGQQTITLTFNGSKIYKTGGDGPYTLTLDLYDENLKVIDTTEFNTSPYKYTDFEPSKKKFTASYSDYGVDTDSNGLFNYLTIEVGLEVDQEGTYSIEGLLCDKQGEDIEIVDNTLYLDKGSHIVPLSFYGLNIYERGIDGPYYLKNLKLFEVDENGSNLGYPFDFIENAYETKPYKFTDFEKPIIPLVALTGEYSDYKTYENGYNLTIEVGVKLKDEGHCFLKARLLDKDEEEILWAENMVWKEAGVQTITLCFDGEAIYNHKVDGPYLLSDVYLYHTGDVEQADYVTYAYTTKPYKYVEFGKNQPPIVEAGASQKVEVFDVVSFKGSFTDPDSFLHTIEWDFGDGTTITGTLVPTHIYSLVGSYTVILKVTDEGEKIGTDSLNVDVTQRYGLFSSKGGIKWSGSKTNINGKVHSNDEIKISGSDNVVSGTIYYVTDFRVDGSKNSYQSLEKVLPRPMPVYYNIEDYKPGGVKAISAGDKYHFIEGDFHFSSSNRTLEGLYYVTGRVKISGSNILGTFTIVCEKEIDINGSSLDFRSYSDDLLFFSQGEFKLSGSKNLFYGIIYIPKGEIDLAGSFNTIQGSLFGSGIKLSGSKMDILAETKDFGIKEDTKPIIPEKTELLSSFPNPAKDGVWIPFNLAKDANVEVNIFNILGQKIRTIKVGQRKGGQYTQAKEGSAIFWDLKNNASQKVSKGLYFYKMKADDFSAIKSMVVK